MFALVIDDELQDLLAVVDVLKFVMTPALLIHKWFGRISRSVRTSMPFGFLRRPARPCRVDENTGPAARRISFGSTSAAWLILVVRSVFGSLSNHSIPVLILHLFREHVLIGRTGLSIHPDICLCLGQTIRRFSESPPEPHRPFRKAGNAETLAILPRCNPGIDISGGVPIPRYQILAH